MTLATSSRLATSRHPSTATHAHQTCSVTGPLARLDSAFSPSLFRSHADVAIDLLKAYLSDTSLRGLALVDPEVLRDRVRVLTSADATSTPRLEDRLASLLTLYISTGIQVHSPGFMGRQFSGVVPLGAIIDLVSSTVNQPSSFYEAAQLPNVVERLMAEELNQFIGWDRDRFAMVTTSGASLGTLTALLACAPQQVSRYLVKGGCYAPRDRRPAIAIGEHAHYSIQRAAGIIGIGDDQIVHLPSNHKYQICADKAARCIHEAQRRGLDVFFVAASAGSTSVGAFDPLSELAGVAQEAGAWLHVDGRMRQLAPFSQASPQLKGS